MNAIIYYASKHGAAEEIANKVAQAMGEASTVNLCQGEVPSPEEADMVVVGGSVYAGMVRKEMKAFLTQHQDILAKKPLGLFLSGLSEKGFDAALANGAPAELIAAAKAKAWLGGIADPQKCSFFERLILSMVTGKKDYVNTVDQERIETFATQMKEG